MLEIIKEASAMLKDLPDLAIWILIGILFYKVVVLGSIYGVIKLVITKTHDAITKPKVITKEVSVDGHFITTDGTFQEFLVILALLKDRDSQRRFSSYIHTSDVLFLKKALLKAIKEDKENKGKQ